MAGTFWAMAVVDKNVVDHAMIHDEDILDNCVVLEDTAVMSSDNLQICESLANQITSMLHTKGHLPKDKKICVVETH